MIVDRICCFRGENMKKTLSRILVPVMLITSAFAFTACGKSRPIDSNWKFESTASGGIVTKAADIKEEDRPVITIDEDRLNKGTYLVTYRQNGKNHTAEMTLKDGAYHIDYVDSDKDMIAKVTGDKLTLTIDGTKGISVVFRYTDEEMLIPADEDKPGPDYVKAKMVDKGKVEIINEGEGEYQYSRFYLLEVQKNGKWYYARKLETFAYTMEGLLLPGGSSNTEEYTLSHYGTLKPGDYRLAVGNRDACIYAYFSVNADGSFSYPQ